MRRQGWIILSLVVVTALPAIAKTHRRTSAVKPEVHRPAMKWQPVRSEQLKIAMQVPAAWQIRRSATALGFTSTTPGPQRAAVGVLKSRDRGSIESAVLRHYQREGEPKEWERADVKIAGHRAIKIVTVDKARPDRRVVHYYIETPQGPYLIECMAPGRLWSAYSPLFTKILSGIRFL